MDEYSAGANPRDSGSPGESELSTVRQWARQTAHEMLLEHGIKPGRGSIQVDVLKFRDWCIG